MRYEFHLPDIGEGLTEAVISSWAVESGDAIAEDDLLCAIETDKALVEITSPCSGIVIQRIGQPGETLKVGTVIAVFDTEKPPLEAGQAARDHSASADGNAPVSPQAETRELIAPRADQAEAAMREVRATPATRRMARELGVDLDAIQGSGPGGRITASDVGNHARGPGHDGVQNDIAGVGQRFAIAPIASVPGQVRTPIAGLRKAVAEQMVRSVTMIPHASSSFRCEAERFIALRRTLQDRTGTRISFTAMVMKAMVPAIRKFPHFNCSVDDTSNEIVMPPSINIGFATHTDDGLIVPVVRNCEDRSLAEISAEIDRLAELARTRKIALEDLRGGTVTLSNVGSHGRAETIGGRLIVNHPQAAIIGITRIRPCAVVRDGAVVARQCIDINMSYDHRIIDGIYAALFAEHLVDVIEEPGLLLAS